jgi:hypothetical protein
VIVADNVAEYVYGDPEANLYADDSGNAGILMSFARVGCLLPPFDAFFIEWRNPLTWRERLPKAVPATGWLVLHQEPDAECLEHAPEAKHALVFLHCFERLGGQPTVSGNARQFAIDAEGNYLMGACMNGPDFQAHGNNFGTAGIGLQTIGFMNCRNVERVDATPTEAPPAKWCRRQRVPVLSYRTIRIDPNLGRKKRSEGGCPDTNGPGKALHICRGHFARYLNDGVSPGLFGRRIYGTFWIPSHTRGSMEHGRIISTYNVNAPRAAG